ncbi:radical SAM family heme chaperone HemW [Psittacicella gerlachiana]|uniref:Heme chaperone HemW n=1 Tax=Psittacicella gerlachiana TaxID=2028574 RepID=A0A3A1Y000_9GAMM|nr:radical SAM family heme chaperone HemW [Psittacicella gerlachiana]RIY31622.1 YggW family oxidoreductase [Psittacicella gerlachiana]
MIKSLPPLSLYIHIPWCVQKCPYCDFNSHGIKAKTIDQHGYSPEQSTIPEKEYIEHLLADLKQDLVYVQGREIESIFIGGGTPSILTPNGIKAILDGVKSLVKLSPHCEITMEANPGTVDQDKFKGFVLAGVNRLSIGIQSFNLEHLKTLGRIHSSEQAKLAVQAAFNAGFKRVNVDLMYGLPNQTISQALDDLEQAIALKPTHLSWYQLTIEPHTLFASKPPVLPESDYLWDLEVAGKQKLKDSGFEQYEVSAYATLDNQCEHNLHYWKFHDYIGIGCGAAGKITQLSGIIRTMKTKHPAGYLKGKYLYSITKVENKHLLFEFFLNRFRLFTPVNKEEFTLATGLEASIATKALTKHIQNNNIQDSGDHWLLTEQGHNFLNSILEDLLPED